MCARAGEGGKCCTRRVRPLHCSNMGDGCWLRAPKRCGWPCLPSSPAGAPHPHLNPCPSLLRSTNPAPHPPTPAMRGFAPLLSSAQEGGRRHHHRLPPAPAGCSSCIPGAPCATDGAATGAVRSAPHGSPGDLAAGGWVGGAEHGSTRRWVALRDSDSCGPHHPPDRDPGGRTVRQPGTTPARRRAGTVAGVPDGSGSQLRARDYHQLWHRLRVSVGRLLPPIRNLLRAATRS